VKLYLRNEICSDEKMLLMPSDHCVFGNYKCTNFEHEIYITCYDARQLKNNKNYRKTISMKINNKRKDSLLIVVV